MVSLKLHRQRWQAKVRIPKALEPAYDGKQFLYRHLPTSDRRAAKVEAEAWEAMLRMEWAEKLGIQPASSGSLRTIYEQMRQAAEAGEFIVHTDEADPVEAGIDFQIERMAEEIGERELSDVEAAKLAALQDALATVRGRTVKPRKELEPSFSDLAEDYLKLWRTQKGLKETNTEQQKQATFALFGGYFADRPIREVRKRDAAGFVDALRQMDPLWARSAKAKDLSWRELQRQFGGRPRGLSDATINRHMATLKSLWAWAHQRELCSGSNPFDGFHKRLQEGKNVLGYLPWEPEELQRLFNPPPKRPELTELMLVAMHTGSRRWDSDRSADRPDTGIQVCRSRSAIPAGSDLRPAGYQARSLHPGGLGRPSSMVSAAIA